MNKPVIIDNNKNFVVYKINQDKRLINEIEIDNDSLKDTSVLYAISIRLGNSIEDWQSQVDAFKTD